MAENEKKVSAAQRKATDKYLGKFDELKVRIPKGQKAVVQTHCQARKESVNSFLSRAITETMDRDNAAEGDESV